MFSNSPKTWWKRNWHVGKFAKTLRKLALAGTPDQAFAAHNHFKLSLSSFPAFEKHIDDYVTATPILANRTHNGLAASVRLHLASVKAKSGRNPFAGSGERESGQTDYETGTPSRRPQFTTDAEPQSAPLGPVTRSQHAASSSTKVPFVAETSSKDLFPPEPFSEEAKTFLVPRKDWAASDLAGRFPHKSRSGMGCLLVTVHHGHAHIVPMPSKHAAFCQSFLRHPFFLLRPRSPHH
jgi:hypothetical protein